MAGIGFELRRLLRTDGGLLSRARGYTVASLVSSGPWIITIAGLTLISLSAPLFLNRAVYEEFRAVVTYAFAFSLIAVGAVQMCFTRRIADLLYARRYAKLLGSFSFACSIVATSQALIGIAFCVVAGLPADISIAAVLLYVVVSVTWLALIWLGATKDHESILRGYVYGALTSALAVLLVGTGTLGVPRTGATLVAAYASGQAITLWMLLRAAIRALNMGGATDTSIVRSIRMYPRLVFVGLFYNAAIWIDQIVFWFADGVGAAPFVRFHPLYDTCKFFAYATVIPTLAVNLIRVETSFYDHYRAFYGSILKGFPLATIEERKARMLEDLRRSAVRLLRIQGFVTIAALLFAEPIIGVLGMGEVGVQAFRACCVGAFFHVLLLIVILIQLYFDLRVGALVTSAVFLVTNGALAAWSVTAGPYTYGIGYTLAAFVALLVGYAALVRNFRRLEFLTFTQPPVDLDPAPEPAQ